VSSPVFILTLATALGCALVGGVFYAFSAFVMPALSRLNPANGIAAMQAINVTAVMPAFMTVFLGTGLACVASIAVSIVQWGEGYPPYSLAGALLYLIGAIGVTGGFHVPRNNALAGMDPSTPPAAREWCRYLQAWTAGNHVRAAAALAAAGLMIGAVRLG
jgi:uncharacterized membrane protein